MTVDQKRIGETWRDSTASNGGCLRIGIRLRNAVRIDVDIGGVASSWCTSLPRDSWMDLDLQIGSNFGFEVEERWQTLG